MIKYGKVLDYDGSIGKIIDNTGTIYLFTKKDLTEEILKDDFVEFKEEMFITPEIEERVARFIKKVRSI